MKLFTALVALLALAVPAGATNSFGKSAHSHWDVHPYANHEVTLCYLVLAKATGAGSEIANFPLRIQDGSNNYELRIHTDGLRFVRRVNGTAVQLTSRLANPALRLAPGSELMIDVVLSGSTFTVYDFTGDVRGRALYQWVDTKWPTGKAFSYYTIGGWMGEWEDVHGRPLDAVGSTHDLLGVVQDARSHPQGVAGAATFDSPTPASGGEGNLITDATAGLASGTSYAYTVTATAGTGTFDVRDPGSDSNTTFFHAGYVRLTPAGTRATLRRYSSSGALASTQTAPWGGAGTYTLRFTGPVATLTKAGSPGSLTTTGNPTSGIRVRTQPDAAARQAITWTGRVE